MARGSTRNLSPQAPQRPNMVASTKKSLKKLKSTERASRVKDNKVKVANARTASKANESRVKIVMEGQTRTDDKASKNDGVSEIFCDLLHQPFVVFKNNN